MSQIKYWVVLRTWSPCFWDLLLSPSFWDIHSRSYLLLWRSWCSNLTKTTLVLGSIFWDIISLLLDFGITIFPMWLFHQFSSLANGKIKMKSNAILVKYCGVNGDHLMPHPSSHDAHYSCYSDRKYGFLLKIELLMQLIFYQCWRQWYWHMDCKSTF